MVRGHHECADARLQRRVGGQPVAEVARGGGFLDTADVRAGGDQHVEHGRHAEHGGVEDGPRRRGSGRRVVLSSGTSRVSDGVSTITASLLSGIRSSVDTPDGDERRPVSTVEPAQVSPPKPLASWYAQGLSDALGDRLLMFDNSDAPSLELLRFRPRPRPGPGFEGALRERVERLSQFRHPAFAHGPLRQAARAGRDLALVSNCTPGKRLSEVLHRAHGPEFAAALIRQLRRHWSCSNSTTPGMSHGVLNPDRIVVSPEGRLTIVEHVLGPAIDSAGSAGPVNWRRSASRCRRRQETRPRVSMSPLTGISSRWSRVRADRTAGDRERAAAARNAAGRAGTRLDPTAQGPHRPSASGSIARCRSPAAESSQARMRAPHWMTCFRGSGLVARAGSTRCRHTGRRPRLHLQQSSTEPLADLTPRSRSDPSLL